MRILFIGNQGNTGFRFISWFRSRGIDAVLLIPKQLKHIRSLPENDDLTLENNYPKWIIQFKERIFPYLSPSAKLRKISKQYDIILTTGNYILPVLKLNKPVCFFPVGGDLTQLPFQSKPLISEIYAYLYRQRIDNVNRIFTVQKDCIWAARLLGQADKIELFPFLVDKETIQKNVNVHLHENLKEKFEPYDWIFFNPARKNMNPDKVNYKGSEKLLKAYKKFIEQTKAKVLMIAALYGDDASEFKAMVNSLELNEYVSFTCHLSLPDLHAYMKLDNVVVFDQFTYDLVALGGIVREALALGSIVVSSTDVNKEDFMKSYGEDCPLLPAFTEKQILRRMLEISEMSLAKQKQVKDEAQKWVDKHIHWTARIDELINKLKQELS
ncbi:MAG: glycosyltransferase [Bacteroidales bacterium]